MGYIDYAGNRMTQINVRTLSVSGDWVLDDEYEVDLNQNLAQLNRDLSYFAEHIQVKESYRFRRGRPTLVSRSATDPDTHERLRRPKPIDFYGQWPIYTTLKDLPFLALLRAIEEVRSKGSRCVP
jgi:hypothetical protein